MIPFSLEHTSLIEKSDEDKRSGMPLVTVLLQGQYGAIYALQQYTDQSKFAVAGETGLLQIWNYAERELFLSRQFNQDIIIETKKVGSHRADSTKVTKSVAIHSLAFSDDRQVLAVGLGNGTLHFLNSETLNNIGDVAGYTASANPIVKISFSPNSEYCAVADDKFVIALLRRERSNDGSIANENWVAIGRRKSHFKAIVALLFTNQGDSIELLSISKDRHIAIYDLRKSNAADGIQLRSIKKIEQIFYSTAAIIYEDKYILTYNTGLKCKLYSLGTQVCSGTSLGPCFAGPIDSVQMTPDSKYYAFTAGNVPKI